MPSAAIPGAELFAMRLPCCPAAGRWGRGRGSNRKASPGVTACASPVPEAVTKRPVHPQVGAAGCHRGGERHPHWHSRRETGDLLGRGTPHLVATELSEVRRDIELQLCVSEARGTQSLLH